MKPKKVLPDCIDPFFKLLVFEFPTGINFIKSDDLVTH